MDELLASEMNFVLSITGFDETSAQTVHARHTFAAQDLRPGHEFVDIHSLDDERRAPHQLRRHPQHAAGSRPAARRRWNADGAVAPDLAPRAKLSQRSLVADGPEDG